MITIPASVAFGPFPPSFLPENPHPSGVSDPAERKGETDAIGMRSSEVVAKQRFLREISGLAGTPDAPKTV